MRAHAQTVLIVALLCAGASLTGCGGEGGSGNKVEMKDMEVVDGTATDAMTDLDGVQSEGTAIALPADNAASNSSVAAKPKAPVAAGDDAEVLADQ